MGDTLHQNVSIMENDKNAVITDSAASPSTLSDDSEARIQALEAEKAKLEVERDNWKTATLSLKKKAKENPEDTDDDARIKAVAQEAIAESRLADIAREQDALLTKLAKENRELKLAQANKTGVPPASVGTHSETPGVQDTLVTPEQMTYFKSLGWDDKKIERYKKNLLRNTR